jgi:SAM-dependent methyltransferase
VIPSCGACGANRSSLEVVHTQSDVPVHSNLLLGTREAALDFPTGTMQLAVCTACGFLANADHDPAMEAYSADQEESQGCSPRFRQFSSALAQRLVEQHGLRGRPVIEIGCGKAEFLAELIEAGAATGIGIDPLARADRVDAERLQLRAERLGPQHVGLPAAAIVCRHTLEHIWRPASFLARVRALAEGAGTDPVVFFEVPDVGRVLREGAFWDVYYEHCGYFTPGSLGRTFRRAGFGVTGLELAYDDQYVWLEARLDGGRDFDLEDGVDDIVTAARDYGARLDEVVAHWQRVIGDADGDVAVWGGGSKAVAFLSTLGAEAAGRVASVVDINPHKQGKFLAGSGHPVIGPDDLVARPPSLVIAMNPVYVEEITADLRRRSIGAPVVAV